MKILYEDNHLVAVNKPCGVLSQKDDTGDDSIMEQVKSYIKKKYNKPGEVFLGSIHRIDRVTSGTLILARTTKGLQRMNEILKSRKISKHYLAILDKRPPMPKQKLVHYLRKNKKANYVSVKDEPSAEAKRAELEYELLAEIESKYLVKIKLGTGRPHQIRAQMSFIGCPITGDTKYKGSKDQGYRGGIYLHSHELAFVHPVKKEPIRITSTPDNKGYWRLFREFL